MTTLLSGSQSPSLSSVLLAGPLPDLTISGLPEPRHGAGSSLSSSSLSSLLSSTSSSPSSLVPVSAVSSSSPLGVGVACEDEAEFRQADAERAYYTWLYTVVYELYVSGVFFYLLPYALIPILNLQLLVAIKQRRDETRRISLKNQHQVRRFGVKAIQVYRQGVEDFRESCSPMH